MQLTNICALVTRPNPAGDALCALISAEGGEAIHLPTIAFAKVDETLLDEAIAKLGEQDWLIFISPQAVYASIPAIRRRWPIFPTHVQFAAIGAGTEKALQAAGYRVAAMPEGEWNSEGLLSLPAFKNVENKKIALIRGEGGRELLTHALTERGAELTHVIAYKRMLPSINISAYADQLKKVNVILSASYESVSNLKKLLPEDCWVYIKDVPLLVMSERIKTLAENLGFQTIWVVRNATNETIVAALVQKKDKICQIQAVK